jgi:hypothetical protein
VILLENFNEWNLSQQKKDPRRKRVKEKKEREKKRSKDWKAKEVKPYIKKLHVSKGEKKKKMKFTSWWERFYRKKERRPHFSTVINPMCGLIHTHTLFVFALPSIPWLFPFLPSLTTPFFINHDYLPHKFSKIFLCFYNIQGVAYVPLETEPP